MTSYQRRQAIINVQERIDTLMALYAEGVNPTAQRYRADLPENIVDGVLALTAERTPEDLAREARSMREALDRGRRLQKAESHL